MSCALSAGDVDVGERRRGFESFAVLEGIEFGFREPCCGGTCLDGEIVDYLLCKDDRRTGQRDHERKLHAEENERGGGSRDLIWRAKGDKSKRLGAVRAREHQK